MIKSKSLINAILVSLVVVFVGLAGYYFLVEKKPNTEQPIEVTEETGTQIPTPSEQFSSDDCEAACGHYVVACLTLVPNATEELFNQGLDSCLQECKGWNNNKVSCMINAFDCEAMTNQCGL